MASRISAALRRLKTVQNPFSSRVFVGEDHFGNTYYEVKAEGNELPKRIMEPKNTVELSEYDPTKIPVQWRAWLTRGRDNPPSPEELLAAERRAMLMAEKVRNIEARLKEQKMLALAGSPGAGVAAGSAEAAATQQPAAPSPATEPAPAPAPGRRPKGLDALQTEPSGSFEHFQPGSWKPSPARRVT
ncbi:hypothetical protein DFJ74DRAFT_368655 [Hyaloraphidium curvatum]|nr:hypothetical protein DFJ74DRAFT_368655 [Hyaloraphidium curvatum]